MSNAKDVDKKMHDISDDDFASPVIFKKFKQAFKQVPSLPSKVKIKKRSKKRILPLQQTVKENFRNLDVDPEHLQMALALSRSTSETSNEETTQDESHWTSGTPKREKKRTLLEFGFKTDRSKMSVQNRLKWTEPIKTNKASKFRYITPVLLLRTEEDRESLIQSKISLILTQNFQDTGEVIQGVGSDVMSEELNEMKCAGCTIFRLNNKIDNSTSETFRVPGLNILENRTKCGSLLKDWKKIPLRDHTPEREVERMEIAEKNMNKDNSQKDVNSFADTCDGKLDCDNSASSNNTKNASYVSDNVKAIENNISYGQTILKCDKICRAVSPDLFDDEPSQQSIYTSVISSDKSNEVNNTLIIFPGEEHKKELPDTLTLTCNKVMNYSETQKSLTNMKKTRVECETYVISSSDEENERSSEHSEKFTKSNDSRLFLNGSENSHIRSSENISDFEDDMKMTCDSKVKSFSNLYRSTEELFPGSLREYNDLKAAATNIKRSRHSREELGDEFLNSKVLVEATQESQDDLKQRNSDDECYIISSSDEENEVVDAEKLPNLTKDSLRENKAFNNSDLHHKRIYKQSPDIIANVKKGSFELYETKNDNKIKVAEISRLNESSEVLFSSEDNKLKTTTTKSTKEVELYSESDDDLPIIKVKSVTNFESISKSRRYSGDELILDNSRRFNTPINDQFLCSRNDISESCQNNISADIKNLDKMSSNIHSKSFLYGASKDSISLNWTEHIEEILKQNYSGVKSLVLSDEEGENICDKENTSHVKNEYVPSESVVSSEIQNLITGRVVPESNHENVMESHNQWSASVSEDNIVISDDELNYSSAGQNYHTDNKIESDEEWNNIDVDKFEDIAELKETENGHHSFGTPLRRFSSFTEYSTPKNTTRFSKNKSESNITPNQKFIIKTTNVTPMANYDAFSTPDIVKELDKFGLKPLKRKRGVNLLKYIYESTHPFVEPKKSQVIDENDKVVKKLKRTENGVVTQKCENVADKMLHGGRSMEPWRGPIPESEIIFERKRSSKISSCQIPLQIVWHNFLMENPQIRENILLYEPLHVEVIHKMLKDLGFKFHLQDLITFFDRKCITIRVTQNQNNKGSSLDFMDSLLLNLLDEKLGAILRPS